MGSVRHVMWIHLIQAQKIYNVEDDVVYNVEDDVAGDTVRPHRPRPAGGRPPRGRVVRTYLWVANDG